MFRNEMTKGRINLILELRAMFLSVHMVLIFDNAPTIGALLDRISRFDHSSVMVEPIGPYKDLIISGRNRTVRWYGHITRSTGLAKMILQGTVQGGRRKGSQKKRREDNIPEWTGLGLTDCLQAGYNIVRQSDIAILFFFYIFDVLCFFRLQSGLSIIFGRKQRHPRPSFC